MGIIKEMSSFLKKFPISYGIKKRNFALQNRLNSIIQNYSLEEKLQIINLLFRYVLHLLGRILSKESINALYQQKRFFVIDKIAFFRIEKLFHDASHEILHSGITSVFGRYDFLSDEEKKRYYNWYHDFMEHLISNVYERYEDEELKKYAFQIINSILLVDKKDKISKIGFNISLTKKDLIATNISDAKDLYLNFQHIINKIVDQSIISNRGSFSRLRLLLNYIEKRILERNNSSELNRIIQLYDVDDEMGKRELKSFIDRNVSFFTYITQKQAEKFLELSFLREKLFNNAYKIIASIVHKLGLEPILLQQQIK